MALGISSFSNDLVCSLLCFESLEVALRYYAVRLCVGVRGRVAALCCNRLRETRQDRTHPEGGAQKLGGDSAWHEDGNMKTDA